MRKKDFVELAKDLNCFWRGFFSDEELKENVDCYWSDYKASQKVKEPVGCMVSLLEQLDEDQTLDSSEWAYRIRKGIKGEAVSGLLCVCTEDLSEWLLLKVRPKDLAEAQEVADKTPSQWFNNPDFESVTFYECFEELFGKPSEIIASCY